MRNPERIDPFLTEVGSLWKEKFPDWRFGQLMFNFFSALGDPFYYEEDELLEAFKAYSNRENPKEAVKKFREQKREQSENRKSKEEVENFLKGLDLNEFYKKLKKEAVEMDSQDDLK